MKLVFFFCILLLRLVPQMTAFYLSSTSSLGENLSILREKQKTADRSSALNSVVLCTSKQLLARCVSFLTPMASSSQLPIILGTLIKLS